jgi:hypothetical protein
MATGTVMPSPVFTGFDSNGDPVSGGLLYVYDAGTSTPATTYSDVNLTIANANPVVLNSAGRAVVYLAGASYKFVLKTAAGATVWSQDNVSSVAPFSVNLDITGTAGEAIAAGDVVYLATGSGGTTAGRWYLADADAADSSSTPQVGMAPAAISSGASGAIRLLGQVSVTGPLTVGATYYVSGTAGALSSTAGTFSRVVGVADSVTSIVIAPNPASVTIAYDDSTNILANQIFS